MRKSYRLLLYSYNVKLSRRAGGLMKSANALAVGLRDWLGHNMIHMNFLLLGYSRKIAVGCD